MFILLNPAFAKVSFLLLPLHRFSGERVRVRGISPIAAQPSSAVFNGNKAAKNVEAGPVPALKGFYFYWPTSF
jgi:hypothetical protein